VPLHSQPHSKDIVFHETPLTQPTHQDCQDTLYGVHLKSNVVGYYVYETQDMHKAKAVTSRPQQSAGVAASVSRPAPKTPKTFQFVDANPPTDAERSQNKILVRSNASNFHWRRVKKSTDNSTSKGPARKRRPNNNASAKPSRRVIASITPQDYETTSTESDQSPPKNEEEQSSKEDTESLPGSDVHTEPTGNLLSLIVSGHYDPFETYPSDLPKEFVSPVLHQSEFLLSTIEGCQNLTD